MDLRQHIDEKFRLRAVVRRITVDLEKSSEAIDQVVDGWREIGTRIAAAPLVEAQAVALIFFERRGIEDTDHILVNAYGINLVDSFASSSPIERINILQDSENS